MEHGSGQDQDNSTCTFITHFEDLKDCWYTILSNVQLAKTKGGIYEMEADQHWCLIAVIVEENQQILQFAHPEYLFNT